MGRLFLLLSIAVLVALLPASVVAQRARRAETRRTETRSAQARRTEPRQAPAPRANAQAAERSRSPGRQADATRRRPSNNNTAQRRTRRPCLSPAVQIVRVDGSKRESRSIALTRCNGRPNTDALNELSILARPHGVDRPSTADIRAYERRLPRPGRRLRRNVQPADPAFVINDVKRLDEGLLERLQKVAARFPNRPIEIVSGYRSNERASSRHNQARAVDIRVVGISRERLRDFARSLDNTGVGYYPNSVFVHLDVRDRSAYWVDRSGPGEEADYGEWPRPQREIDGIRAQLLVRANAAIDALDAMDAASAVELSDDATESGTDSAAD